MSIIATTVDLDVRDATKETTLSNRLSFALSRIKISQSELARRIGVKPQIIQYLCTTNATKSKFAYEIATALEINPNWLIAGKGSMFDLTSGLAEIPLQQKVPILSWSDISIWIDETPQKKINIESIFVAGNLSKSCFGLRVVDTSMVPRFEIGTILIIDPSIEPKEDDYVVIQTQHQPQAILRQLIYKNNTHLLMPINTAMYKVIEFNFKDRVFGVLRQTHYEFVRT